MFYEIGAVVLRAVHGTVEKGEEKEKTRRVTQLAVKKKRKKEKVGQKFDIQPHNYNN